MTVFGSEVDIVHIFGVPLTVFNYSSQVFPPLLMAAVLGPLYKGLKRLIPENVQLIFVPFLVDADHDPADGVPDRPDRRLRRRRPGRTC